MEGRLDRAFIEQHAIVLFDGYCNLCTRSVQFILPRDRKGQFYFLSLQDDKADTLFALLDRPKPDVDSVVVVDKGRVATRSSAALHIAARLKGGWPLFTVFWIIPKFIRDAVYDWIARNRYRWFGQKETCWLPQPEWKARFL